MSRIGSRFVVGGVHTSRITPRSIASVFPYFCRQTNSERAYGVECKAVVAARRRTRKGCHCSQETPDWIIVAAALTVVLVCVTGIGIIIALRPASVEHVPDMPVNLHGPVVHHGPTIPKQRVVFREGK